MNIPPGKLLGLGSLAVTLLTTQPSAAADWPVREALEPLVNEKLVAGVVTVIADRERVRQLDAIGFASLEEQRPMSGDTLFWVASQSKPVTAVAVMMLVEAGRLDLDKPVTDYLPELKELRVIAEKDDAHTLLVPVARPITLRHLLSHTSGMVWITPLQQRHRIDVLPFQKIITVVANTPLAAQPGEKWQYSNMGVNVAATIVEKVSGKPFDQFLEERLFKPLGMTDTTFWPTAEQLKRLAPVYGWDKNKEVMVGGGVGQLTEPYDNRATRYPEAAGGLFSTPNDFVKFWQMLLNEGEYNGTRILRPESVKEIGTKQTGEKMDNNYGLCVGLNGEGFGHGGACGTDSRVDLKAGLALCYFVQQNMPRGGEVSAAFFKVVKNQGRSVGTEARPVGN
ncbi:MAG: beta-lactamase family protein [Verrucomicrobiales bacterium]|jgi:CubicO group peptidase (beta-lactamase class C family)|nr:beta-lactamase family protein [Verrucomicrobiales bacterium]